MRFSLAHRFLMSGYVALHHYLRIIIQMAAFFRRVLFLSIGLLLASCGVPSNAVKTADSSLGIEPTKNDVEPSDSGMRADDVAASNSNDVSNSEIDKNTKNYADKSVEADENVVMNEIVANSSNSIQLPSDSESAPSLESAENTEGDSDGSEDLEESAQSLVKCDARIDFESDLYTAQAVGPTIEEARDNAVDEACSIPCAESLKSASLSDDELEAQIDACAESCSEEAIVIAAACFQDGASIYTEGAWSETNDPAPTNGDESKR